MKFINKILFLLLTSVFIISCEVDEFSDLNNPEVDAFSESLTRGDLQDQIGGVFYSMRVRLGTYYDGLGVIGREFYRFSSSDPRFTSDLLGKGTAILDNNTFYTTAPWGARYRTVKNANLILGFIDPSKDLSGQFTNEELSVTRGFLKTMIAYELLLNLNMTYDNGIRLDVADESNLGPFVSRTEALVGIRAFLEDGASDLAAGGDFPFRMASGFADFSDPSTFLEFNKAVSARVAAYQEDYPAVLNFLNDSFFDIAGDLGAGPSYVFTEDQTDLPNPLFFQKNATTAGARIAHPTFVADALTNDTRLNKISFREVANDSGVLEPNPLSFDGLSGAYDFFLYTSRTAPVPIIRNEELILLYAEANINTNATEAVAALDAVRTPAGVGAYTGGTSPAELIDELLVQRRYSLYGEGHRWVDMRRFDRLNQLPIDRVDDDGQPDDVWVQFPIPLTENQ